MIVRMPEQYILIYSYHVKNSEKLLSKVFEGIYFDCQIGGN
jgi:hypothetical protein